MALGIECRQPSAGRSSIEMTLSAVRPPRRPARIAWWAPAASFLGLAVLQLSCGASVPSSSALLKRGEPIERRIGGRERHVYPFTLSAGHFLYLKIDQPGIDVAAVLTGPDGKPVATSDDPDGRLNPERIAQVAAVAGRYRLTVAPHDVQSLPGIYRIELLELRPGRSEDRKRAAAEREFAAGRHLQRLEDQRSLREAVVPITRALDLWRDAEDRGGQVRALNELAFVEYRLSEDSKASDKAQEALRMARQSRDRAGEATALNLLGDLCGSNADVCGSKDPVHHSLELQEQALSLWRQLGSLGGQGRTLSSLGLIHLKQPDDTQALKELQPAWNLLRAAGDTEREANALVYLQGVYYDLGDVGKAREYAQQALELSRSDRRQLAEGSALYNLGRIDKLRGDLETSLKSFEAALTVYRRIGGHDHQVGVFLQALGSIHYDLGDLDEALEYYRQALAFSLNRLKDPKLQARLLNHIGFVLYSRGDRQEALRKYGEALALSTSLKDSDSVTALAQFNLGVAKIDLGQPQEGLAHLQTALKLRQAKGTLGEQAQTLREIGTAYHHLHISGQAAATLSQALKIGEQIGSPVLTAECLYRWALLERDEGRLSEALAKIEKTIAITESVRSRMGTEAFRTSFFASKRVYSELQVDLLMRLHTLRPGGHYEAAALDVTERARARGLLELLSRRIDLRQGIAPELKQRETELGERLTWLLDQLRQQNPSQAAQSRGLQSQLGQAEEQERKLEAEIHAKYPHYAGVRYPTPLRTKEIEGLLDDQTALLQYFLGKERSFLFVVTHGHLASYELPAAGWITDRVRSLRSVLDKPNPLTKARFCQEAAELYGKLLSPAASSLEGKRHFLIAPDGPLYFLPFEALLTKAQGLELPYEKLPYLLLDHTVSYVPSASVLASMRLPRPSSLAKGEMPKMFVGFADPIYGGPPVATQVAGLRGGQTPNLPPLPRSREEVEQVARFYPGNEMLYLGASATKRNVTKNTLLKNARRIHFATHGLVNEIRPELSALALTPEGTEDDGLLRVSEIFNLELASDLVVLSACETGLGKQVVGEGVLGLTRAFLYAGARSVVVSLWPVLETGTPELMKSFYHHLDGSGSKVEALRASKLDMIRRGQANPSYWAPFILAGDPI
jgi:CHAT domain-containing protein/tetratricopeptide (TPR) repeat protein